jgi:glutathione S-transferase
MNAIVVYESIYGNTRAIAEAVADGLGGAPVVSPDALPADVAQADLLVVGGPTHIHGMATARSRRAAVEAPQPPATATAAPTEPALRDWLADLSRADGACAAAFDTRLDRPEWLTGAASHAIAKRLRRHGYTVMDSASFLVTGNEGPLKDGELERARLWGTELAASTPAARSDAEVTS